MWNDRVLPCLIHAVMRSRRLEPLRRRVAGAARGVVLELGIGSGLNLPFYGREVERLVGIDPQPRLLARARRRASWVPFEVVLYEGSAEELPLEDASVDTVVSSWTLCSIAGIERALSELRRVLRPGGRFLFVEHGLSADPEVARWQQRLTPLWRAVAGGCHLDRPIPALIERAGLLPQSVITGYLVPGPRIFTYHYLGRAVPPSAGRGGGAG